MRFNVDRMGEYYQDVNMSWLASITTAAEFGQIQRLKVGERISFMRPVTGSVGAQRKLEVVRVL